MQQFETDLLKRKYVSPQWGNVVELPGNFRAIINQNKTYLIIYGNQDGTQHASKLILIKICAMEKN